MLPQDGSFYIVRGMDPFPGTRWYGPIPRDQVPSFHPESFFDDPPRGTTKAPGVQEASQEGPKRPESLTFIGFFDVLAFSPFPASDARRRPKGPPRPPQDGPRGLQDGVKEVGRERGEEGGRRRWGEGGG